MFDISKLSPAIKSESFSYTCSRGRTYEFNMREAKPGRFTVRIVSAVDYGERSTNPCEIKVDHSGGTPSIAWYRPVQTFAEARALATDWSERTSRYIEDGRRFDSMEGGT